MNAQNQSPDNQNPIEPANNGATDNGPLTTDALLPNCPRNSCNDVTHVTSPAADPPISNLLPRQSEAVAGQPATCNGQSAPLSNSQTPQIPNSAPSNSPPLQHSITPKSRRRNGLVAQLSKSIRDRINQFLDDGLSYPKIVKALCSEAPSLTARSVMSWKQGGYQDYLRQQQLLDECRARTERAFSMLREQNPLGAFQATQQIATAQICEAVADIGPDILRQALAANPLNYFRMLNSFARLTNGGLKCDRHLQEDLDRRAKTMDTATSGRHESEIRQRNGGFAPTLITRHSHYTGTTPNYSERHPTTVNDTQLQWTTPNYTQLHQIELQIFSRETSFCRRSAALRAVYSTNRDSAQQSFQSLSAPNLWVGGFLGLRTLSEPPFSAIFPSESARVQDPQSMALRPAENPINCGFLPKKPEIKVVEISPFF